MIATRQLLIRRGKPGSLRDAIERCTEIVGEAAHYLSPAFRDAHPHVPWRAVMSTRHIVVHDYDAIDNDTVWRIVTDHLPPLIEQVRAMLPPEPPTTTG